MGPLVSVIIPVYNVELYLRDAIESVINQTYRNLEIIIIDDGSTDGSGAICDEYSYDHRVKVIHQENKGLSAARNAGLDLMTGNIVAFLDSDDLFCSCMIEELLKELGSSRADIAVCDFHTVYSEEEINSIIDKQSKVEPNITWDVVDREEALQKVYDTSINYAPWNKLYRREVWKEFRFPEGHTYEGTYTVFDLFNKANSIAITEEKLIIHRERQGSITATQAPQNISDWILAFTHFNSFIKDNTPNVFTVDQMERKNRSLFDEIISAYVLICRETGEEWKQLKKSLRRQVKKMWKYPQRKALGCKRNLLYIAIYCCPFLLRVVFESKTAKL